MICSSIKCDLLTYLLALLVLSISSASNASASSSYPTQQSSILDPIRVLSMRSALPLGMGEPDSTPQQLNALRNLPVGPHIDIDRLIITAVFADRCYAEPESRAMGVAIFGATGLAEGDLINLHGTKAESGQGWAVNYESCDPLANNVSIGPLGIPGMLVPMQAGPSTTGLLVRIAGWTINDGGRLWIDDGCKHILIYGNLSSLPAAGSYICITGISATDEDLGVAGIRVRRDSDINVLRSPATVKILDSFCRGGQLFLHWSDTTTDVDHYHVYRSSHPIDSSNISKAELLADSVMVGSAKDRIATYIAESKNEPDPNIGLRINDLGPTLDPRDGLLVQTVTQQGKYYYAVVAVKSGDIEDNNIVAGYNSLAKPLAVAPGESIPVVEEDSAVNGSGLMYPYKKYIFFRNSNECQRDGEPTKFCVTLPYNYDASKKYQTLLSLHAYGGYYCPITWWDTIAIAPCDITPYLNTSDQYSWWYGWCDHYPDVTQGTVVNYTENLLLHLLQWTKQKFAVDENRMFVGGGSMGGTGAVSFGLRHPEIFAGVAAAVPQVNPGLAGIGWSQDRTKTIWGQLPANLPTSDGMGVWDRMNMTKFVSEHQEDLPFLKVQNSKNDDTLLWFQIPDFYRCLDAACHGFIAAWGQGGHGNSSFGLPPEYLGFDIYSKIRKNLSYVAISKSSANDNPGNGDKLDGDSSGQMNAGYDWTILTDTPAQWSGIIKYKPGNSVTADVSVRRLQQFHFTKDARLSYVLKDKSTDAIITQGVVTAERANFFIIPQLPFDGSDKILTIEVGEH